jgi:hypothetical protein
MTAHKVMVQLDEKLVQRLHDVDAAPAGVSDAEAIERVLSRHLARKALRDGQAASPLTEDDADRIAVEELHAMRRERNARDHAA